MSLPDAGTGEEAEEIAYETLEYETQMKCPACELFFPSAPQMVEHFDLESEQKLICGQCQKSRKNIASFPHEWVSSHLATPFYFKWDLSAISYLSPFL